MAERRMFTQKIVDSDAFLDMPLSSQALYFHLNMRADDDGFVNNSKKIQRMIGASEDDLKLLIAKRFVLCCSHGVIVIKHWRMHNLLRKDRYNPTQYKEQKAELILKENGAYTENHGLNQAELLPGNQLATTWQPPDNQLAPQVRIDKDSIVKESIGEERKENAGQQIADLFNSLCPSLPSVKIITEKTEKEITDLLTRYTIDDFKLLFTKTEASAFLKGKNERKWAASFDWLIKEENIAKVLNGNFDNKKGNPENYAIEEMAIKKLMNPPKTAADDENIRVRAEALQQELSKTS